MINKIIRFITNIYSRSDADHLRSWSNESTENLKELTELNYIYDAVKSNAIKQEQIDNAFARLQQRIAQEKEDYSEEITLATNHRRFLVSWKLAASILVLFTFVGLSYWCFGFSKLKRGEPWLKVATIKGQIKKIVLPDGTLVWLNGNSTIEYPPHFTSLERNVVLKGEGYFEVTHNQERPFVVDNEGQRIRVLGTKFNVSNKKQYEVSLLEGSVDVSNNISKNHVVLRPGQKAVSNKQNGEITIVSLNTSNDALWHYSTIAFNKASLESIMQQLQTIYGIKIEVNRANNQHKTYSGEVVPKKDINEMLMALQKTMTFKFKKVENSDRTHTIVVTQ